MDLPMTAPERDARGTVSLARKCIREGLSMETHVSESIEIAVPPSVVYTAVTNVADMGRWSPECTGADVKDNGLQEVRPGMKFTGHNRSAKRPWSTQCTVMAAEPGERFAFLARGVGLRVAIWTYRFEPLDFGQATKVTETWIDQRGWFMHFISPRVSGIRDRATHNRQTMKVTLQRLKKTLEKEHPST
ncbi:SRPBCC family protein [Streptomyces sp. S1A1-7]|nr:SRPBCC family protein [Streptomyces sp. S1A1-7]QDO12056.1 SRPBCC family protein [Streptomyces sp. S1D4-23]